MILRDMPPDVKAVGLFREMRTDTGETVLRLTEVVRVYDYDDYTEQDIPDAEAHALEDLSE